MPEPKNLDRSVGNVDAVKDEIRRMRQLTNAATFADGSAQAGEIRELLGVVDQGVAKSNSGLRIVLGNKDDNSREILNRTLTENYLVAHEGIILRTSSMGTPPCSLSDRIPSSMAASMRR